MKHLSRAFSPNSLFFPSPTELFNCHSQTANMTELKSYCEIFPFPSAIKINKITAVIKPQKGIIHKYNLIFPFELKIFFKVIWHHIDLPSYAHRTLDHNTYVPAKP